MNNNLEGILKAHISDATAIQAIVGTRIFPDIVPQGTPTPFVSYHVVSQTPRDSFLDGTPNCTTDAIVQIDCWSTSYVQVCNLRNAVCAQIENLNASPDAMLAQVQSVQSLTDDMGKFVLYRRSVECQITYN